MRHVMALDLGLLISIVDVLGALLMVWFAQAVTRDFGLANRLQIVKFAHRLAYLGGAFVLAFNAYSTLEHDTDPRAIDLLTLTVVLGVLLVSGIRHLWVVASNAQPAHWQP